MLRLVSTCNTKQPDPELRRVRVLWVEEADGEPLLHEFERLAEAVLPFTRKEVALVDLVAWIIPKDVLSSCFSTLGIT